MVRSTPLWEEHLEVLCHVVFVQVGANCGGPCRTGSINKLESIDPVWEYASRCKWRGAVVEPNSLIFEQLHRNYRSIAGVQTLNVAISNVSGMMSFFRPGKIGKYNQMDTSEGCTMSIEEN